MRLCSGFRGRFGKGEDPPCRQQGDHGARAARVPRGSRWRPDGARRPGHAGARELRRRAGKQPSSPPHPPETPPQTHSPLLLETVRRLFTCLCRSLVLDRRVDRNGSSCKTLYRAWFRCCRPSDNTRHTHITLTGPTASISHKSNQHPLKRDRFSKRPSVPRTSESTLPSFSGLVYNTVIG